MIRLTALKQVWMVLKYDRMSLSEGKRHRKIAHPGFKVILRYDSNELPSQRGTKAQNLFFLISPKISPHIGDQYDGLSPSTDTRYEEPSMK